MKFLLTAVVCLFSIACNAQITNPKDVAILKQTTFIDVYTVSRDSKDCEDLKYVDVVDSTGISPCFHILKKLSKEDVKRILELFTRKRSLIKPRDECETTDLGMTFLNENRKIIWYGTFSLLCNAASFNSDVHLQFHLTNSAKLQLIKITGIRLPY